MNTMTKLPFLLQGFKEHVDHDHNMWDYVYYSLYLDNIDTGDHNAIQKYVYEQVSTIIEYCHYYQNLATLVIYQYQIQKFVAIINFLGLCFCGQGIIHGATCKQFNGMQVAKFYVEIYVSMAITQETIMTKVMLIDWVLST